MLHRVLISPSIFSALPDEENTQKLLCNAVIKVLLDILDNCAVVEIFEQERSLSEYLQQSVDAWPIKYKQRIRELIKKLKKRNRFIVLPIQEKVEAHTVSSLSEFCQTYIMVLRSLLSIPVIVRQNCCIQLNKDLLLDATEIIDISDYDDSKFSRLIRNVRIGKSFNEREKTREEFEQEILIPIFRDAKHVKVFDRYIGRSIIDGHHENTRVSRHLKEGYRKTLEWMLEIFDREAKHPKKHVEVYTGIDSRSLTEQRIQEINQVFQSFHMRVTNDFSIDVKFFVKKEKEFNGLNGYRIELPHARYLITDQIGISIDRGFDLLQDDRIRDVNIALISEPHKIENATKKLQDLMIIP